MIIPVRQARKAPQSRPIETGTHCQTQIYSHCIYTSLKEIITRAGFQVNVFAGPGLTLKPCLCFYVTITSVLYIVQPGAEGATPDTFQAHSRDVIDASQARTISAASSKSVPCPALLIIVVVVMGWVEANVCIHSMYMNM